MKIYNDTEYGVYQINPILAVGIPIQVDFCLHNDNFITEISSLIHDDLVRNDTFSGWNWLYI